MRTTYLPVFASLIIACASGEAPPTGDGDGDASIGVDAIGEICVKDPCDIYEQCGCDDPQVCDLNFESAATLGAGETACRDVTSPGTETSACANVNECAAGYVCLGGGGSQCRKYCEIDTDCNNGFCLLEPSSGGNPIPGVKACTKNCVPTSTNPVDCPSDFGCGVFDNNGTGFTDCIPANAAGTDEISCADGAAGDPCAPGFTCIIFTIDGVEDRRVCKQRCVLPDGACPTNQTCTDVGSPSVDGVEYGACT